jgi:Circadian oscillating protein COP23
MKVQKSLLLGLTTVAIALAATPTFSQSSSNKSILFGCETIDNTPTTIAYNSENPKKQQPLIKWKKEYIDSENISLLCDNAAQKLQSRYKEEEPGYLAFEPNSNNQTVVCLINQRGKSCNLSGEELFRIKTVNTREDLYNALVAIVDPNLSDLDKKTIESRFRGVDKTYSRMKPRNFLERWLSRKY